MTMNSGLLCPFCGERTTRPHGNRIFVCENDLCPGGTAPVDAPGRHASRLVITAMSGVSLVPWATSFMIDEQRITNPGVMIPDGFVPVNLKMVR